MDYFKILRFLQHGDKDYLSIPFEAQARYILSLGQAKDDIERSYKQYLCQLFFEPKWKRPIFDTIAATIFIPLVLLLLLRRTILRPIRPIDAYGEFYGLEELLPVELNDKYKIVNNQWEQGKSLGCLDLYLIFLLLTRHCFAPFFVLKCVLKLSIYSHAIRQYAPRVIIVHNELSYTVSFLTMCCNKYGIKHINVMHGEKLFNIRDSYFRFDECYVWSKYYVNLFKLLNVEMTQMRISVPPSIKIETVKYINADYYSDFKYYLAFFNEEEIQSIVNSMSFASKEGKTVKYRPHPRYSNLDLLRKYVDEKDIEWPKNVGILESISNLEYAVGSYTTVLNQAYHSGKGVILDDVTYKDRYNKLKEYKYILSNVGLPTLSQFQKDLN